MTCDNCAHGKVCAYRKTSQHLTDIENRCDLFLDLDHIAIFPFAVGESVWVLENDQIEQKTVYHIRLNVENEGESIVKGKTETRIQIFALGDNWYKPYEITGAKIGVSAFLSFADAIKAAIKIDNSAEQIRYNMFRDYLQELQEIEEYRYMSDEAILESYINARSGVTEFWMDIYPDEADKCAARRTKHDIIGFWILGKNGNCHPDADYFIAEAYIKPEYRREGIMSDRISDWIEKHRKTGNRNGKFCLFVLSKNEVAKKFWKHVFDRCGYEPYKLSDIADDLNGHLIQLGYKPKE